MKRLMLFATLSVSVAHAQVSTSATSLEEPSIQAQFDAATALLLQEKWSEALAALDLLQTRLAAGTNQRRLAIVRLRRAEALAWLDRLSEAEAAITENLPLLGNGNTSLTEDRLRAMITRGMIAERRLNYEEATRYYTEALDAPGPAALRVQVLRGLIHTTMFSAPATALAYAQQAVVVAGEIPDNRRLLAQISGWRGRVLLNQRRLSEAREALNIAIEQRGGITELADAADIGVRADMALVTLLLGDRDNARRYLASAGSGRQLTFLQGFDVALPACGRNAGPQDVAVIELAVGGDGRARNATPVYTTRWSAGYQFAQTARRWRFDRRTRGGISRISMRCSLDDSDPSRGLASRATRWEGLVAPTFDARVDDSIGVDELRTRLAAAQSATPIDQLALFEALTRLAQRPEISGEETRSLLLRAIVIAREPLIAARIDPFRIASILYHYENPPNWEQVTPALERLLQHPVARENLRVANALRLMLAFFHYYSRRSEQANAVIQQLLVASPIDAELRREAIFLQIAILAGRGDWAEARAARDALGEAPRCGISPVPMPVRTSSRDFPREARRWGFEGWAHVEAAVSQDGSVSATRAIIGYPAFVFDEAGERLAARFALAPTLSADGQPCHYIRRIGFELLP